MIPLRSALRSSSSSTTSAATAAAATCRRCRPTTITTGLLQQFSTSVPASRPVSHYLRPTPVSSAAAAADVAAKAISHGRGLHSTTGLLKDKKWLNHADEEGEAEAEAEGSKDQKDVEAKGKKSQVEGKQGESGSVIGTGSGEAESSKTASERAASEGIKDSTSKSTSSITAESSSSNGQASSSSASAPAGAASGSGSGSGSDDSTPPKTGREIAKPSIPETYPQVLALPITRRPLFPGFYKAVTITSPPVIKAIRELLAHGQPYIGAFLLKDSDSDSDVITSMDQVHPVGVFAQITSVFGSTEQQGGKDKEGGGTTEAKPETLTAVLYPHRRIRIDELITSAPPPSSSTGTSGSTTGESVPITQVVDAVQSQEVLEEGEGEVASFETEVPSVDAVKEDLDPKAETTEEPAKPLSQIGFLHPLLPSVSLTNISNLKLEPYKKESEMIRAIMGELVSVFKDIAQLQPIFREQITSFTMSNSTSNVFDEPDKLADFAAAVSTGDVHDLQAVLESLSVEDRLQKSLLILKKELINAQLQNKISRDVESKIQKRQREYYLMEQLKGIKKELGMESDGKDKLVERFKEKAAKLAMPEGVRKVFDDELSKLTTLEPAASEFNVTRNYLDWLTQVPWGVHSPENYNITHATQVLDEDHYGLKDVKDRILEFLAVGKLRGTVEGKIICLVGPPGVGKTSIGKSIARALGRQFYRFSVGGLTDVAEIKGHRRTYVGAMPGKPIQALKKVATENPLILIDEVDKIGRGHNGDPSSALLEMLDPEQNTSFLDHYMDVPVDLSRVLFVCTANVLDTIPAPLLDRMEVLEVAGYVSAEKMNIAERYLSPQAKTATGLKDVDITLHPEAIEALIRYYCRESGVRNLKKHIDKIYRKAAFKIVSDLGETALPEPSTEEATSTPSSTESGEGETRTVETQLPYTKPASEALPGDESKSTLSEEESRTPVTTKPREPLKIPEGISVQVTNENLRDYVGPPIYHKDRLYTNAPPAGVSTGLGYLGNGSGAVMPVEVTSMPGKGNLQLTGKLGEVIRESAQIALSWVKSNAWLLGVTKSESEIIMSDRDLHLHMPEGAIGKEGPSAGTAILTAFVSLFTKTKVDPDVAMTGEISLHGQVLPVGGLKEKILAAHRAGIKKLIVPSATKSDIDENVPDSVKSGIEFVFVDEVRQVLHEVFKGTDAQKRWVETLPTENEPERVIIK